MLPPHLPRSLPIPHTAPAVPFLALSPPRFINVVVCEAGQGFQPLAPRARHIVGLQSTAVQVTMLLTIRGQAPVSLQVEKCLEKDDWVSPQSKRRGQCSQRQRPWAGPGEASRPHCPGALAGSYCPLLKTCFQERSISWNIVGTEEITVSPNINYVRVPRIRVYTIKVTIK